MVCNQLLEIQAGEQKRRMRDRLFSSINMDAMTKRENHLRVFFTNVISSLVFPPKQKKAFA